LRIGNSWIWWPKLFHLLWPSWRLMSWLIIVIILCLYQSSICSIRPLCSTWVRDTALLILCVSVRNPLCIIPTSLYIWILRVFGIHNIILTIYSLNMLTSCWRCRSGCCTVTCASIRWRITPKETLPIYRVCCLLRTSCRTRVNGYTLNGCFLVFFLKKFAMCISRGERSYFLYIIQLRRFRFRGLRLDFNGTIFHWMYWIQWNFNMDRIARFHLK